MLLHTGRMAHVTGEVISLMCPVGLRRIVQAVRTRECTHAAVFCRGALPGLTVAAEDGSRRRFRCPHCAASFDEEDLEVDVALTLLL